MKYVEGLDELDAEQEWQLAFNDQRVSKEQNEKGEVTVSVQLHRRYSMERGAHQSENHVWADFVRYLWLIVGSS